MNIKNPMIIHGFSKNEKVATSLLEKGIVTEDLADGGKAYGTKEVGDWLASNI